MSKVMISLAEAMDDLNKDHSWKKYQVDYPEASRGRFRIEKYEIPKDDLKRLLVVRDEGMDRDPGYGSFTRLVEDVDDVRPLLWMSDTRSEIYEHKPILDKLSLCAPYGQAKRVLVNGLGLGLVVHAALLYPEVEHIDVVESNPEVAELTGLFLPADRVTVHVADAYEMKWPRGTRWDLAWHDIWPTISDGNIAGQDALYRKYSGRIGWQASWQRKGCLAMARLMRQAKNGTLSPEKAHALMNGRAPW